MLPPVTKRGAPRRHLPFQSRPNSSDYRRGTTQSRPLATNSANPSRAAKPPLNSTRQTPMTTKRKFLAISLAVAATAILSPHAESQQTLQPPPAAKIIALNPAPGRYTEPSIAINPKNPNQIAAAFQAPASVAYSTDAGATWQIAQHTAPANYAISGDVSLTYDSTGHAILCYIAFDKLGTSQYWAHNATRNGIFIRRSLDGGETWESNAILGRRTTHAQNHAFRRQARHRRRQ